MKKGIVIAMLIIAVGLAGCVHYSDRDDRGYGHGHDYEQHDRWGDDHGNHR